MKQSSTLFALTFFLSVLTFPLFSQCPPPGFPEPGDMCQDAPILCETLDGYCATINNNNIQQTFPGCPGNALNNDEWFAFYAGSTTITFEIVPSNCQQAPPTQGLQAGVYQGCGGPVMDTQCGCTTNAFQLSSNNFIIGEIYWVVIDGCGGDVCDYVVNVLEGNTQGNAPDNPGTITGPTPACMNDIATYTVPPVQGATIYSWELSPMLGAVNSNGNSAEITWLSPGTTQLCLSVANACFPNPTQTCTTITIEPNPAVNITPAPTITCTTSEIQLNSSGSSTGPNFSYQWTTVGGNIVSGATTPTPTVDQAGTYELTITNTNTLCTSTQTIVVMEDMVPPIADAGSSLELNCAVPQFPLFGFGSSQGFPGYSYQWTTPDGNIVSGATTLSPIIDAPGTYTITVVNLANGCESTASTIVTLDENTPLADAGPDMFINCVNSQVTIDASGSTSGGDFFYVWMTSDGNIVSGETTTMPVVDQSGTYFLTVVNSTNGCTDTSSVVVDIDVSIPVVNIVPPIDISCSNPSITINGSGSSTVGDFTYTWTTPDGNIVSGSNTLLPEVDQAGTYTLTILNNISGCSEESSVTVSGDIVNPTVIIEPPATVSCTVPEVVLDASNSDSGPNITYTWTTADGQIVSGANGPNPTVSAAGTYELTVLNQTTNCSTTETVQVDISADTPVIMLDPVDELNCTLEEIQLNANISGGQNLSFNWSTADGNFVSGSTTLQPTIDAAGTYEIIVTNDDNGCEEMSSITVTQDAIIPATDAGPDGQLTCSVVDLALDGSNSDGGGNITYNWSTADGNIVSGAGTTIAQIDAAGTYVLTLLNTDNTCVSTDTVVVTENVSIINSQIVPPVLMGCLNPTLILDGSASTIGATVTYAWSTPDGNIISNTDGSQAEIDGPGTYTLLVYDVSNDCFDSAETTVIQNLDVPVIDAGPDGSITCTVTDVQLLGSASGQTSNFVYQWTTANGNIAGGGQTLSPTVDLAGTYTLMVTDTVNQCSANSTVDVTQDADVPVSIISASNPFNCDFPAVTLDGSGSTVGPDLVYTWSTPDGNIVSNPDDLTAIVDQAGSYTLLINDTVSFCMSTTTFQVTPDTLSPILGITPPELLTCNTTMINLDGNAGGLPDISISWNTADGNIVQDDDTFNPLIDQPGTYTLSIINNENGCQSSETIQVLADVALPIVDAGPTGIINCIDEMLTLDGTADAGGAAVTYQWTTADGNINSGADTPSPVVDAGGTYQLTVTNTENGCINSSDVTIDQDQVAPSAIAGAPGLLNCYFPEIQLDGSASSAGAEYVYQWTTVDGNILTGNDTQIPTVDNIGTYTLTVTNTINGCESVNTVDVTEDFQAPTVDAGADALLNCMITSTNLNGTGSMGAEFTYTWTTLDGNIVNGANTLNPEIDLPGTYQLEIFNTNNGCTAFSEVNVQLDAVYPSAIAVANDPITCTVQSVQIDGNGSDMGVNYQYNWSTLDGNIISGGTTLDPTVDLPGTYTLTVTNMDNACESFTNVVVAIDTLNPMAEAGNPDLLTCAILELNLDGTGSSAGAGYQYQWTSPDGNILSGATNINPLINQPGTYEILVTDLNNGCESTDLVVVDQDIVAPTAVASANEILTCDITSLFLSGTGSSAGLEYSYSWSTLNGNILNGGTTLTPEINQPGQYTISILNTDNGCSSESSVTVDQDIVAPTLVLATPAELTCATQTVSVNAGGSSSGINFAPLWTTINGNILSGANSLMINVDAPGTYTLLIENASNGCTTQDQIVVSQDIEIPTVDAGVGFLLPCFDDITNLDGSASANSTNLQYDWQTFDGVIENNANTLNPGISSSGLYTLTVTNLDNGCVDSDDILITEDNPSTPDVLAEPPLCSDGFGFIEVSNVTAGSPPYMYSIDNGETYFNSPLFANLSDGNYQIIVQDALGCESGLVTATIDIPDPVEVYTETLIEILQGESYQFNVLLNVDTSTIQEIIWSPAEGLSCTDCLDPVAAPLSTTIYTVEVILDGECRTIEEVELFVDQRPAIYAPNIFSPDNDGVNDVFYLFGRIENIRQIRKFLVFDRWGEKVHSYYNFQPNNPTNGWDGNYRGKLANPGVFVWFAEVELIDGRVVLFEGDVTLVR
ncbi:MAG: gliding motility-associated C-terminal domain-containing protein [Saprospiraceae bacterium]|nr:gliding motility-associated C-terminal domain-containing protein [Saprospiraceae bacterium]